MKEDTNNCENVSDGTTEVSLTNQLFAERSVFEQGSCTVYREGHSQSVCSHHTDNII